MDMDPVNAMSGGMNMTGMGHMNMTDMGHMNMTDMDHMNMTGMDHMNMTGMDHNNMTGMDHNNMTGMDHNNMTGIEHIGDTSHHGTSAIHAMKMYFNFDLPIYVLFIGWEIANQAQLAGSCVGVLLLAILYEGIKTFREFLYRRTAQSCRKYLQKSSSNGDCNDVKVESGEPGVLKKMFNGYHILHTLLQIVQTTLGMFLMLIYMTFNVWLAVSVSLGSGVGYFLFSWDKRTASQFDDNHCI